MTDANRPGRDDPLERASMVLIPGAAGDIHLDQDILEQGQNMEKRPPLAALTFQQEVQLRFLGPNDIEEVKALCREWFPIEYPHYWYKDITSSPRFYSLAATHHSRIIGLVIAELKTLEKLNKEDADLLAGHFPPTTSVAYILNLGVVVDFRRNGIASLLLDSLLSYLTSKERCDCKAVYLHVLSTNTVALRFYERRQFRRHLFLPYYYAIGGKARDGYSYVLYINGGQPPWSILDYLPHCKNMFRKLQPCALPRQVYNAVRNLFLRLLSRYQHVDQDSSPCQLVPIQRPPLTVFT